MAELLVSDDDYIQSLANVPRFYVELKDVYAALSLIPSFAMCGMKSITPVAVAPSYSPTIDYAQGTPPPGIWKAVPHSDYSHAVSLLNQTLRSQPESIDILKRTGDSFSNGDISSVRVSHRARRRPKKQRDRSKHRSQAEKTELTTSDSPEHDIDVDDVVSVAQIQASHMQGCVLSSSSSFSLEHSREVNNVPIPQSQMSQMQHGESASSKDCSDHDSCVDDNIPTPQFQMSHEAGIPEAVLYDMRVSVKEAVEPISQLSNIQEVEEYIMPTCIGKGRGQFKSRAPELAPELDSSAPLLHDKNKRNIELLASQAASKQNLDDLEKWYRSSKAATHTKCPEYIRTAVLDVIEQAYSRQATHLRKVEVVPACASKSNRWNR